PRNLVFFLRKVRRRFGRIFRRHQRTSDVLMLISVNLKVPESLPVPNPATVALELGSDARNRESVLFIVLLVIGSKQLMSEWNVHTGLKDILSWLLLEEAFLLQYKVYLYAVLPLRTFRLAKARHLVFTRLNSSCCR